MARVTKADKRRLCESIVAREQPKREYFGLRRQTAEEQAAEVQRLMKDPMRDLYSLSMTAGWCR